MSHAINALLLKGPFDAAKAAEFGLQAIPVGFDITLFLLSPDFCDEWAERLKMTDSLSERPLLNCEVIHHMARTIAVSPLFAIIETDYYAGLGAQYAVVYRGATEVMPPAKGESGPINQALRILGVGTKHGNDEFDTIGLGNYRSVD